MLKSMILNGNPSVIQDVQNMGDTYWKVPGVAYSKIYTGYYGIRGLSGFRNLSAEMQDPTNRSLWMSFEDIKAYIAGLNAPPLNLNVYPITKTLDLTNLSDFFVKPKAPGGYNYFSSKIQNISWGSPLPIAWYLYTKTPGTTMKLCEKTGKEIPLSEWTEADCRVEKSDLSKILLPIGIIGGLILMTVLITGAGKKKEVAPVAKE